MIRAVFLLSCILASGVIVGCAPAPKTVLVGLECGADAARLYGPEDGHEAAKACKSVTIHNLP